MSEAIVKEVEGEIHEEFRELYKDALKRYIMNAQSFDRKALKANQDLEKLKGYTVEEFVDSPFYSRR